MRTATNETALMAKAAPLPTQAMSRPAAAGPISRPALWTVEFSDCALT